MKSRLLFLLVLLALPKRPAAAQPAPSGLTLDGVIALALGQSAVGQQA